MHLEYTVQFKTVSTGYIRSSTRGVFLWIFFFQKLSEKAPGQYHALTANKSKQSENENKVRKKLIFSVIYQWEFSQIRVMEALDSIQNF